MDNDIGVTFVGESVAIRLLMDKVVTKKGTFRVYM
jgi:hypothetical protein